MNGPQGCWHPLTEARMPPHTILRDLNQLLYRIFNSKKVRDNFGFLAFCSFFPGSLTVFHNSSRARQQYRRGRKQKKTLDPDNRISSSNFAAYLVLKNPPKNATKHPVAK